MTNLLTRLKDWEHVYPCDMDKPLGSLYEESFDKLSKAIQKLEDIEAWIADMYRYAHPGYERVIVFRDLPELIEELKS